MSWHVWPKRKRPDDHPGPGTSPEREASSPRSVVFTEGQRRHLEIAFRSLLTSGRDAQTRIRRRASECGEPPGSIEAIATEIDELIVDTRRAATAFELSIDTERIPWHRDVAAWASTSWSMILDCRPSALRGYGPVDAHLTRALGPVVDGLAARLMRIGRMAEGAQDADQRHR